MSSRVLVLGAGGMLGHVVRLHFLEAGWDVTGTVREGGSQDGLVCLDATSPDLDRFLSENSFDLVINCIGVLNKAAEDDPARAIFLNSYLPHKLESVYLGSSTRVFQPSTDCIFAGNTGPYAPDALPDGRTFYDRTKALGELQNEKDLTFRMSIVGPDCNEGGIGLFNWFMHQEGIISGYAGAMWTGVTTMELAAAMEQAYEEGTSGLIQYVPDEGPMSKYDMLCLFRDAYGKDIEIVAAAEPRLDKTLLRGEDAFSRRPPSYKDMFFAMRAWTDRHKDLYPHYAA